VRLKISTAVAICRSSSFHRVSKTLPAFCRHCRRFSPIFPTEDLAPPAYRAIVRCARKAEREAAASALAASAPVANGSDAPAAPVKPKRMLSRHDPKLAPATALLRARIAENDGFVPIDALRRAAVAAGIEKRVLANAAAHLNLKVSHRGSTEGFELKA
jgi:hypothetical protein